VRNGKEVYLIASQVLSVASLALVLASLFLFESILTSRCLSGCAQSKAQALKLGSARRDSHPDIGTDETIVGETTGGGAHPVERMSAGDHFTIGVPFGRPINPVTHGDWEGTGVEPDVKVSAAEALSTAEKLAADKLTTKDNRR
jgi:hypothetical protein